MSVFSSLRSRALVQTSLVLSLIILAFSLRLAASNGPLWLDEIWSLNLAGSASSPLQIFTAIRHDNNHFLNTLYLFAVGPDASWIACRLLAVFSGCVAVLLAGAIAGRRGRLEQVLAVTLMACSYLMVHYSSEARGYALLIVCSLAAYESLGRFLQTNQLRWGFVYALCGSLGFLAHPTFASVWLAGVFWSLGHALDKSPRTVSPSVWRRLGASLIICHLLPLLTAATLYAVNWRFWTLGGGPSYSMSEVLIESASLALGGPQGGTEAVAVSLLLLAAISAGMYVLRGDVLGSWRFLAVVISVPVIQALLARPPFLFVRYFLVPIVFSLLLLSFLLADWLRQGGLWRWIAVAAITFYLFGNGMHCQELIRLGRGDYPSALQFMAAAGPVEEVHLTSDHHHGTQILVDYYARYLRPPRQLVYDREVDWTERPPEWLVLHRYPNGQPLNPPPIYQVGKVSYRLKGQFNCAPLSGWCWLCYQRQQQ